MSLNQIFERNIGVFTKNEQTKLSNAKVTVIGAGGVGGITLISLARMGIGNIKVVDMDVFDYSNLNRQMLSGIARIGKLKAECAQETLLDINPNMNVTTCFEKMTEDNVDALIEGSDVVVDATDTLVSRVILHRAAQKAHIPSVWIAVTPPFRGGVMVFSHETPPYELVLRHPSYNKSLTPDVMEEITKIKDERAKHSVEHGASADWANDFIEKKAPWTVIAPVANIVGILASFEALKLILQREELKPSYAPNLVKVDLSKFNMVEQMTAAEGSWENAFL